MRARMHHTTGCPGSFNPRPPFPGGDARFFSCSNSSTSSFNPRPPFPGGDAVEHYRLVVVRKWVSIHAPRFREAMPMPRQTPLPVLIVSIHAPRFREAMPPEDKALLRLNQFQSTPPVSGRRCIDGTSAGALKALFQSTPPVSGRRCSSPVTTGSIRTKSPHYANLFIPEQKTSYAYSPPSGKPHQIRQKRGARTYRGIHVHLGFAQAHRMRGASKSVARKQPCSRTS